MDTFFKIDISERYKHILKKKNNRYIIGDIENIIEAKEEIFKDNKSEISGNTFLIKE